MPKITDLAAATALTDDDLLVVVDAPGGAAGTRKITALNAATYFGGAGGAPILDGAGPPDDEADGEAGDYYLDTAAHVLYGPKAAGVALGAEQSVASTMPSSDESYGGPSCQGQKYQINNAGGIVGVEFRTPSGLSGGQLSGYVVSVWSADGTTLHAQKTGSITTGDVFHTIYLDAPFMVTPGTDYIVAVGYPSVGANNRTYCHVNQATVTNGVIVCDSGGLVWTGSSLTAFPSATFAIGSSIAALAPIFAEPSGTAWPVALDPGTTILDGTATPTPADGEAGDYYADTDDGVLYGPKSSSGYGAAQVVVIANAPNNLYINKSHGVRYQFARGGRIAKVRFKRHSGDDAAQRIQVWNNDAGNAQLDSVVHNAGAVTGEFDVTLTTPITVPAGAIRTFSYGPNAPGWGSAHDVRQTHTNTADLTLLDHRQGSMGTYPDTFQAALTHFITPIFEPDEAWPTTVRIDAKGPVRRIVNNQTATTYTPVAGDENTMVTLSNAAAITVTLPQNSDAAFPVGAEVDFLWLGAGQPTFAAGSGATVNGTPGLKLRAQYSAATAKKVATNGWVVIGDLSA